MNSLLPIIIKNALNEKKFDVVTESVRIVYPDKKDILVQEYHGPSVRLCTDGTNIRLLYPKTPNVIQENSVTEAIANGTIFDDAESVNKYGEYIEKTTLPCCSMMNKGINPPNKLRLATTAVIGRMDDDEGSFPVEDNDISNGVNFLKDAVDKNGVNTLVNRYLGNTTDDEDIVLRNPLGCDIATIEKEISSLSDISDEDAITQMDYDEIDTGDDDNTSTIDDNDLVEEGFRSKRPKKLKPIPRDIIAYITVEMNAIQDTNDQAMLSGYTCSKLELVDFCMNVIDTNDGRYIVPNNKAYLTTMQNELNRLLTQILKIRPVNKNDRVWQVNVNYPENWRG